MKDRCTPTHNKTETGTGLNIKTPHSNQSFDNGFEQEREKEDLLDDAVLVYQPDTRLIDEFFEDDISKA